MWEVQHGEALALLKQMPSESVHCVVTSPPYWGLRVYGGEPGMIGQEPTFEAHLENLVAVFGEVRRVLRSDGTFWLNYGDAYSGGGRGEGDYRADQRKQGTNKGSLGLPRERGSGLKPKNLLMMPARIALALQADGWWLRSEIVWKKDNPMPESVTDRPTSSHEKVFLLSKSPQYFYDAHAVRVYSGDGWHGNKFAARSLERHAGENRQVPKSEQRAGANLRNVWSIATRSYPDAHFAVFPPALPELCIKAGTSEYGVCTKCGAPRERVVETPAIPAELRNRSGAKMEYHPRQVGSGQALQNWRDANPPQTTGWRASCEHEADSIPALVLDPFCGSGTTGMVALRLERSFIGLEINAEYCEMARRRIVGDAPLFNHPGA